MKPVKMEESFANDKFLILMKEVSTRILYAQEVGVPFKDIKESYQVMDLYIRRLIRSAKNFRERMKKDDD